MNFNHLRKQERGYASLIMVLTTATFMLTLMLLLYKRSITAQEIQADVQMRISYQESEEAVLRAFVSDFPNRAINAMMPGSDNQTVNHFWRQMRVAGDTANAGQAISDTVSTQLGLQNSFSGNSTDSFISRITRVSQSYLGNGGPVTSGVNRDADDFPAGFPPVLNDSNALTSGEDTYPRITFDKEYGALASPAYAAGVLGADPLIYKKFNRLKYPDIGFGYTTPGSWFVAKRNWWAFNMTLGGDDAGETGLALDSRTFILSLYEVPSQLPISASSFMSLGAFADGSSWQNVHIDGNIFGGRIEVVGDTAISGNLSTRRGATLSSGSTVSGHSFTGDPFAPGTRENFELDNNTFFPVSLASESGRACFISINRGAEFFDRFAHSDQTGTESPTTWNEYSVGALQCAMRLDVTDCVSTTDDTPTELEFSYLDNGLRESVTISLTGGSGATLPDGYVYAANENNTVNFATPTDLAYESGGDFYYKQDVTGNFTFNDASFGISTTSSSGRGYSRPPYPFEVKQLATGKNCIAVYPERFADFFAGLGADGLDVNNSIAINVDYPGSANLEKPNIPCTDDDYGVILQECSDLSEFQNGFSLVTNMRLYIGDDFNTVEATSIPAGYSVPTGEKFYPPSSLFTPEKRYGVDYDPFAVQLSGQVGSVASEDSANAVNPLDSTSLSGASIDASSITVNLSPIDHPAELPPITMMNWLITLEEVDGDN